MEPSSSELRRCHFTPAPPRRFLYPALLLLLAEQPGYGYRLVEGLGELGLSHIDRPSVYRALGELSSDGLVTSWEEPPSAGSTRHVYDLTPAGRDVLEQWMSVVAGERRTLDTVLERYWYRNARELRPTGAKTLGAATPERASFEVAAGRSCLIVEARSNIGPIAFSTTSLRGAVRAALRDGLVSVEEPPSAHVELDMASLSSGNRLYDSELMDRVGARRHPEVTLDLVSARRLGDGNCYEAAGELTLRGVTRSVSGAVTVTLGVASSRLLSADGGRRMTVTGEQVLDIREFDIEPPAWGMLRIYPDVRLRLHLEAAERPA